jgi:hypothetical protein
LQVFGNVSIFDSCTGTQVAGGLGVFGGAGVDVSSDSGSAVPVSLAGGELSVGEGAAGAQEDRITRIDTAAIKTLVIILKLLLGSICTGMGAGRKRNR